MSRSNAEQNQAANPRHARSKTTKVSTACQTSPPASQVENPTKLSPVSTPRKRPTEKRRRSFTVHGVVMDVKTRELIERKFDFLFENITLTAEFYSKLLAEGVYTSSMLESIWSQKNESERKRDVILTLKSRGKDALKKFLKVLRKTGHEFVADTMEEEMDGSKRRTESPRSDESGSEAPRRTRPRSSLTRARSDVSRETMPVCLNVSFNVPHASASAVPEHSESGTFHMSHMVNPAVPPSSVRMPPIAQSQRPTSAARPSYGQLEPRPMTSKSSKSIGYYSDVTGSIAGDSEAYMTNLTSHIGDIVEQQLTSRLREVQTTFKGDLEKAMEANNSRIAELENDLAHYKKEIDEYKSKVDHYEEEVQGLKSQLRATTHERDELQKENEKLKERLKEQQRKTGGNQSKVRVYEEKIKRLEKLHQEDSQRLNKVSTENQSLRKDKSALQKRNTQLHSRISSLTHVVRMKSKGQDGSTDKHKISVQSVSLDPTL